MNLHEHEDCTVLHGSRQDLQAVAVEDLIVVMVVRDDRASHRDDLVPAAGILGSVGGQADVEWSGEEAAPGRVKAGWEAQEAHPRSSSEMLAERSLTMQMRSPVARLERKRTRIPTVAVTNRI